MSIHQTPGMPRIHQRFALRRSPPAGVHWMMSSQTAHAKMSMGSLRKKRNCGDVD
jgi:hypothetical protein